MKKSIIALALVVATGVFGLVNVQGEAMAVVKCPASSMYPNEERNTYAECNLAKDEKGKGAMDVVNNVINVILSLVGIVAVIMIIIGGINFVISQGDANKVTKARNTILYGVVGLVIAILAFGIVNFVLSSVFTSAGTGGGSSQENDG